MTPSAVTPAPDVPAILIVGTASDVGKSFVATGLCRLLARRGLRVVPFKAQNMSNNAAPARGVPGGGHGEIGRAQAVQAEAAGVEPHVDMNPILLKPMGEAGVQVVLRGRPMASLSTRGYYARREQLWQEVIAAYAREAAGADVVIIEGAGSPAELNLRSQDLVTMAMARHSGARVLLVGDIERGGVFASLHGTIQLLEPEDRERIAAVLVNRFHGDVSLFEAGIPLLEAICGVPCLGVLPHRGDIQIDEEDCLALRSQGPAALDVCVLRLPRISNFTDFSLLKQEPGLSVRYASAPEQIGNPDLLVLPGSKDSLADLRWLKQRGLDRSVRAAAARSIPILGLCGGYQLLGERIADPRGVGGSPGEEAGLALLPLRTEIAVHKQVEAVRGATSGGWLLPPGLPVSGYEIHAGRSTVHAPPLVIGPREGQVDGAVVGLVAGTYVHGLLDSAPVRAALIAQLRERKGLPPVEAASQDAASLRMRHYDRLADLLEDRLDLGPLLEGLPQPQGQVAAVVP